jgi:hypothetical protein
VAEHNPGVSPERLAVLCAMSLEDHLERAERNIEAIGLPPPVLRHLFEEMADIIAARINRRCACGAPVDISGRTYEMMCWRCFLDYKASQQRKRKHKWHPVISNLEDQANGDGHGKGERK